MGWFRKHLRHGTWLALLALALQFGLSFGHVHAAAPTRTAIVAGQLSGSAAPTAASVTGLIYAAIDAEYGALTLAPSDQSDHPPGQTSPDDCAICAVLALANIDADLCAKVAAGLGLQAPAATVADPGGGLGDAGVTLPYGERIGRTRNNLHAQTEPRLAN